MSASLLPSALPKVIAAAVAGCDIKSFRRNILDAGLVELDERGQVDRRSLERHLGFEVSVERYLIAERGRDGERQYRRDHARNTSKRETADAVA